MPLLAAGAFFIAIMTIHRLPTAWPRYFRGFANDFPESFWRLVTFPLLSSCELFQALGFQEEAEPPPGVLATFAQGCHYLLLPWPEH